MFERLKKFGKRTVIKAVTVATCAAMSLTCLAMSAFAEGTVDTSSYDTVTTALTDGFGSMVSKCAIAIAGVVGVGLTIFGIKWLVKNIKSFFNKLT